MDTETCSMGSVWIGWEECLVRGRMRDMTYLTRGRWLPIGKLARVLGALLCLRLCAWVR